jgi:3-oxoadipate enol-lactonase
MATIQLPNGARVWYESQGSGPTIFHIHGSAFGHRNFERLTPHLLDHLEVIDFDLPGYGASSAAPHGGGIDNWADDVAALIRALGHDRAHVHGTSLGGMIGLSLAARHPDVVDHVVLSCFVCRYDEAARVMRSTWITAAEQIGMSAVADLTAVAGFSRNYYERPEAAAQLEQMREAFAHNDPAAFVAATRGIFTLDLSPLAADVKAPLLLLAGSEDHMTPVEPAPSGYGFSQLVEAIPEAELAIIPDCGHYLVIEQPEAAARHVIDFIRRGEGKGTETATAETAA